MASVSAYKAGSFVARHLPDSVGGAGSRVIGNGVAAASGDKAKIIARNLERVLGRKLSPLERRRKVAETFEWYTRYYLESFRLPDVGIEQLDREFSYEGVGEIEAHTGPGSSGAILALPHLGSWEWAAFWLARIPKVKVTAIVEPLDPPEVFDWFVGLRESLGMEIHALGADAGRKLVNALKEGHLVTLLSDRDLQGTGVPVTFFGERTTLPAGPATLALRLGVPLIPAAVPWLDTNLRHGLARPPLVVEREGRLRDDVTRITQMLAHEFEYLIRLAPEQWHMLSPNWPSDYEALGLPVPKHLRNLD